MEKRGGAVHSIGVGIKIFLLNFSDEPCFFPRLCVDKKHAIEKRNGVIHLGEEKPELIQ